MKIGILRETVHNTDARVAIIPQHAKELMQQFPNLIFKVQPSNTRVFTDSDYQNHGAIIDENLNDCDLLIGIKEVDISTIIPEKKYLFFAHVAKKQEANRTYFQELAQKKITLLDFEYFVNRKEERITSFGFWAGFSGLYHAVRAIGIRYNEFLLPNAMELASYENMLESLTQVQIPPIKILVTGDGLTSAGVTETLEKLGVKQIKPASLKKTFNQPVYCQLVSSDYIKRIDGKPFYKREYYKSPELYESVFYQFTHYADVYLPCHFWDSKYPKYLETKHYLHPNFQLRIIADVSCDINGPIASTLRESTLEAPYYDYNPFTCLEEKPFSSPNNIVTISVSNLPASLPKDASIYFSKVFCEQVLPSLLSKEKKMLIDKATILQKGKLTSHFSYLYDFLTIK